MPVWNSSFVFRDAEGHPHVAFVISDISERKQSEEALQQSLRELKTLYEGMSDGLLIADLETKQILRMNPALRRMLGYTESESQSLSILDIYPPKERPAAERRFADRLAGRDVPFASTAILRKDGAVVPVEITSNVFVYANRLCVTGFYRDISDRKRAQEALQREYRTLEHLLQSSDHERQMIAYEIHDGLAQYLASSIMQFQAFDNLEGPQSDAAKKIFDGAMVLLAKAHSESRRLISGVRPPVLDEEGVLPAIDQLLREMDRVPGPKLEFHGVVQFNRLAPILENAIYRIIQEGMTNACRHSGGDRVRVTLRQQEDRVRIEIRDWGRGFDPNGVNKNSFGLAGIRQRARLLGGKCRIQSAPGKGSRIVVILPLTERET